MRILIVMAALSLVACQEEEECTDWFCEEGGGGETTTDGKGGTGKTGDKGGGKDDTKPGSLLLDGSLGYASAAQADWLYDLSESGLADLRGKAELFWFYDDRTRIAGAVHGSTMMNSTLDRWFVDVGIPDDDPIWFSLIVLMALEMSATTPPFGLLLFIMMGMVRGTTLGEVALAAAPFLFCDAVLIALLIAFPMLGLYLPSLMG